MLFKLSQMLSSSCLSMHIWFKKSSVFGRNCFLNFRLSYWMDVLSCESSPRVGQVWIWWAIAFCHSSSLRYEINCPPLSRRCTKTTKAQDSTRLIWFWLILSSWAIDLTVMRSFFEGWMRRNSAVMAVYSGLEKQVLFRVNYILLYQTLIAQVQENLI